MRQQRAITWMVERFDADNQVQQVVMVLFQLLVEFVLGAGGSDDEDGLRVADIHRNLLQKRMIDRYMTAANRVGLVMQMRGRNFIPNDVMGGL